MKTYFKNFSFFIILSLVMVFSATRLVWGWTGPTLTPPYGNLTAPLNLGAATQTKTGGLNIATEGGYVGIGTTNPGSKLTTFGDIWLDSAGATNRTLYFRNQNTAGTIQSDKDLVFSMGGIEKARILLGGNVGIGTGVPNSQLHLYKNDNTVNAELAIQSGNATTLQDKWTIYNNGIGTGDGSLRFWNTNVPSGGNALTILKTGNVGIGTTAPVYALDVLGTIRANSTVGFRSVGQQHGYVVTKTGVAGDDAYAAFGILNVGDAGWTTRINKNGSIGVVSDTNSSFTGAGNVGIGTTNPVDKLQVIGNLRVNTGNQFLQLIANETSDYAEIQSGDEINYKNFILARQGGNVGIGTTNPLTTLSVIGTTTSSTGFKITTTGNGIQFADGSIQTTAPGTNSLAQGNTYVGSPTNLAIATSTIYINPAGNVGIGITTPGVKLHVIGEITASTVLNAGSYVYTGDLYNRGNFLVLNKAANGFVTWATRDASLSESVMNLSNIGTTTTTATLGVGRSDVDPAYSITTKAGLGGIKSENNVSATPAGYFSNSAGPALVTNSGNVGIGTTNPGAKLDVDGTARLNGNLSFRYDQTAYLISGPANGGAIRIRSNGGAAIDRNVQFGNVDNLGVWTSYMTIADSGSVGIGTTAPMSKLDARGSIYGTAIVASDSQNTTRPEYPNAQMGIVQGSADNTPQFIMRKQGFAAAMIGIAGYDLGFEIGGAERMRIASAGNVGIGLTNPADKLSIVNGGYVNVGNSTVSARYGNSVIDFGDGTGYMFKLMNRQASPATLMNVRDNGFFVFGNQATIPTGGIVDIVGDGVSTPFLVTSTTGAATRGDSFIVKSDGKVGIGTASLSTINATAGLFSSVTPKTEILTGSASGTYKEAVVIRHNSQDSTAVSRELGLLLKASNEGSLDESNKMSGMMWWSTGSYGNGGMFSLVHANNKILTSDFSGNIGIGTTAPGAKLEVAGTVKITGGIPGSGKVLTSDATGLASWTTPTSGLGGSGTLNKVAKFTAGTTLGDSLIFDNGTNVGIGTAAPSTNLHVAGVPLGTTAKIRLQAYSASYYTDITHDASGSTETVGTVINTVGTAPTAFNIQENGTSRLYIKAGGNVGIGTAAPEAGLDVGAGDILVRGVGGYQMLGHVANLYFGDIGDTPVDANRSYMRKVNGNEGELIINNTPGPVIFSFAGTEQARITNTGRVGIGTTAPAQKLQVIDSSDVQLSLGQGDSTAFNIGRVSATGELKFYGKQAGYDGYIFSGASGEKMRILSNGTVGIGVTNPDSTYKLVTVGGGVKAKGNTSDSSQYALYTENSSSVPLFSVRNDGNVYMGTSASINGQLISNQEGGLYFGRSRISENQFVMSDISFGNNWTAKASSLNWYGIAMSSDGKYQTATVSGGQIYTSTDFGNTWTAKASSLNWREVAMSSDGKYQSAGGYNTEMYVSVDYGNTWTAKDIVRFWTGIAMSSDGKNQTANQSGGMIFVSTDYGNTWTGKGTISNWLGIAMSSNGKYQIVSIGTGQFNISTDYGNTWTASAFGSGLNWRKVAVSSDGKYQTAVVANGQIYTSYADSYIYGGNVGIGTTAPAQKLDVQGGNINTSGNLLASGVLAVSGTDTSYIAGNVGIGYVGNPNPGYKLYVSGDAAKTVGGTAWTNLSDGRLKDEQGEIGSVLDKINKLRPIKYKWNDLRIKEFGESDKGVLFGFIAQEMKDVFPEFISEGKKGFLMYNPSGYEAVLTAAIQEQQVRIDGQQKQIEELMAEISELRLKIK